MTGSFLIWENKRGRHYLHGRYYGDTVEQALDQLAKEQVCFDKVKKPQPVTENGTIVLREVEISVPRPCRDKAEWFQKSGTQMGNFRFEEVRD